MKLSLDWNCVIEVEEKQLQAEYVQRLIECHRAGRCEVALLATSGSENTGSKLFPGSYNVFMDRITALGWHDLPHVPMPGVYGLTFFGHAQWVDDGDVEESLDRFWQVIASATPRNPHEHLPSGEELTDESIQSENLAKWRNAWCDVMSAYTHVHAKRDIFVTNNTKHFQKNAERLAQLGMKMIRSPRDALAELKE